MKITLKTKRVFIMAAFVTVLAFATAEAFTLLLIVFRLGFFINHDATSSSPAPHEARPSPRASPVIGQSPSPTPTPISIMPGALIIPVVGVRPEQLRDTYNESRAEGRAHNALDIMASCGTPVVATAEGRIVKLFTSERGGTTIYQMGVDGRTIYYYAHLARYADDLAEGRIARQGQAIGYAGDTGNAGVGNCHLHFAIWAVADPKRYWDGENINPYLLLRPAP